MMKKMIISVIMLAMATGTILGDTGYQARKDAVLKWAETQEKGNFLIAGAMILSGRSVARGIEIFEEQLKRPDNSPRGMFVIHELMAGYYAAGDTMPDSLRIKIRDYVASANFYRGDTENHLTMYYTGLYLMSQAFPDLSASETYTGKTPAENMAEAIDWLHDWMRLTTTIGQGEFDSPTYMTVFLSPMFTLYQWAEDPLVKKQAYLMLHWLIADYGAEHLYGVYGGAHSREYPERIIQPRHKHSNMTSWGWLFFGQIDPVMHTTLLTAAWSDFDIPEVLYNIGTDREEPYVHTETKRVRHVIRLGDERNPKVYKYTYMTKDFVLGSMMGGAVLQPIQQHVWDVSFMTESPYMTIFTVHPYVDEPDLAMFFPEEMKFTIDEVARAHTYYGSEDKWSSSSPYEETFQHENAIIVLYNIPEDDKFGHINGFFPRDMKSRDVDESGWIFCHAGQTYIAYFPLKPYKWIEEDECYRLRSHDRINGCVVEVAAESDYGSFKEFKSQIRSNNIVHDTFDESLTVSYTTSAGNVMTFTHGGVRRLNGDVIDFSSYGFFSGPFLNAELNTGQLEIIHKNKGIMLDMSTLNKADVLPVYICNKIDAEIKMNGKLDDPAWEKAEKVSLVDAITGEKGRYDTSIRVLHNGEFLYVGFECEDEYIWGTVTERNGPVYDEECVEVFLNPADAPHQYYEINLSPKNVVYDACVLNHRTLEKPFEKFEALFGLDLKRLKTAVHVDGKTDVRGKGKRWTAEYAIPFDALYGASNIPPQPGDVWRVNFYRIDSPQEGQREHYAWSPTDRAAFHLPWRFGFLKFSE
ncbi:MAG: carbohydrate-binding family 9-like protein [candidate division KSB1 bacterium]|jgi:hypothetical protein|nr:carbohydrate-binding family 9-like protein [candidate division KSB1 bacterium]